MNRIQRKFTKVLPGRKPETGDIATMLREFEEADQMLGKVCSTTDYIIFFSKRFRLQMLQKDGVTPGRTSSPTS
jgi:hypothetical protein